MKCALVTGGSRGIGKAICKKLAEDSDYHIIINYNSNKEAALDTLKQVQELGNTGEIIQFDVADADAVKNALDTWMANNEDSIIEVLINNAGITKDGLFMWMPAEDWHSVINTSLNGFYNVTNHLIQKMLSNRYGRIINMVSVSGVKGDEAISNDGNNWESNWDPIWYLETNIDEEGWTAEARIPLSQLRFGEKAEHIWGIQIQRRNFRVEERSTWSPKPINTAGWVSFFGELHGIKGVQPQKQIEIMPYVVAQIETSKGEGID